MNNINVYQFTNTESGIKNSEQLEALFNNATIGIIIINNKGEIINFNEFATSQFGYTREEITGLPIEMLIPYRFRFKHVTYRNSFYEDPQTRIMGAGRDLFTRRKDNSEFPVEISLSPFQVNNDIFVIAFIVDITVRKNSESILRQQKEELEEKTKQIQNLNFELEKQVEDRTKMLKETLIELEKSKEELRLTLEKEKELSALKSRFVSMASHEFRTPLSTILSSVSLAQKYNSPAQEEKRNKHLLRIQDSVRNMTFILIDFLSLGKLEEGLVDANLELLQKDHFLFYIDDIIQEMLQITKEGQELIFDNSISGSILVDKNLLHNILVNLISNAIKYSPENTRIIINCVQENAHLKISVTDNGIGIPEEDQKYLFERFFRAKNVSSIQGTGLGLHIINRYLQLMNGTIELSSKLNEGTTFIIYIPQHSKQ